MKKAAGRNKRPIREVIQTVMTRSPGAWQDFVQRTASEAAYLIDQTLRRRGVVVAPQIREDLLFNVFRALCEEDFKLMRALPADSDPFRWLTLLVREACRTHVSGQRKQAPLGAPRTQAEPDVLTLAQVLEEISGAERRRMIAHFEGERRAPAKGLREILATTRAKVVDLLVSGAEPTTCLSFERLSAFADGVSGEKIMGHLETCTKCAQELERIAAADRLLRDVLIPRPTGLKILVSEGVLARVGELVTVRPRPRPRTDPAKGTWGR